MGLGAADLACPLCRAVFESGPRAFCGAWLPSIDCCCRTARAKRVGPGRWLAVFWDMSTMNSDPVRDAFDGGGRGLQHQGLRRANERAVLSVVGFNPGVSNADIARLSGLAPQTVSAILAEIDRAGLITRGEVLRGRRGQPATPIFLKADGAFSIGVEIGWRHLDVLLLNLNAE